VTYIKKLPPKPLPEEFIDGKPLWTKSCPKCNRKQIYYSEYSRRRAIKLNRICKWCQNTIYFLPNKPWIKKCVDCDNDVELKTKFGFLSLKPCRCKKCFNIWQSKFITDKYSQIQKSGYKWRPYVFPNGRIEIIQGYESYTLNYLISSSLIQPDEIKVKQSDKPVINYTFDGTDHPYIPDAFISNSNTVIETKSTWTWKVNLDKNLAKIKGVNDAGYDMRVFIWKGNQKLISNILYPKNNIHQGN